MQAAAPVHAEPTKSPLKADDKATAVGTPDFDSEKLIKDAREKVRSSRILLNLHI